MDTLDEIYDRAPSLFSENATIVIANTETMEVYGEDGKEYTLQVAPWEIEGDRMTKETFKVGEYIIYQNGDKYELGRISSIREDGAFVCYHEGETAAKTPWDKMHKLMNGYAIVNTTLGGERVWE